MAASTYRDSVVERETGELSDEIDNLKVEMNSRIDRVMKAASDSLKDEFAEALKPLEQKVGQLGGKLPSTNSRG